ncbi:hypothetical protein O3P69_004202 [Scylla paramamosain]|uniref:Uncharacterized protein n=1 Tax=Scylla paramamosain TaxID=85552 RepID=A0AAW0UIZ1_SCYPA
MTAVGAWMNDELDWKEEEEEEKEKEEEVVINVRMTAVGAWINDELDWKEEEEDEVTSLLPVMPGTCNGAGQVNMAGPVGRWAAATDISTTSSSSSSVTPTPTYTRKRKWLDRRSGYGTHTQNLPTTHPPTHPFFTFPAPPPDPRRATL